MAEITTQMVKEFREATSAGVLDCKKALAETDGDFELAVEILRKKGLSDSGQEGRTRDQGRNGRHVHPSRRQDGRDGGSRL